MRILFLGEPSSANTVSWVEGLRRQGCDVHLASVRSDGSDGASPLGPDILPPRLRILTASRHLARLIAQVKPDLLLAYRITSYGFLTAKSGFHPLVIAAQNEQIVYLPRPSFLRRSFLSRCARFAISEADLIHSWGGNITAGLQKFGAPPEKILTLHRGIDTDAFKILPGQHERRHSADRPPVFISSRSLAPEYLIDNLIKAFRVVVDKLPGSALEIAGTGPEEDNLKNLADNLGLSQNVRFHGALVKNKMASLLNDSDIYVSTIRTEGISSSLLEAAACGLIPVVADIPSSREIVTDEVNGFLVSSDDPGTLAEVMIRAASSRGKISEAVATNSKMINTQFNRDTNQKTFILQYSELIEQSKKKICRDAVVL